MVAGLCIVLSNCATPISPTGGPPDEAAPVILLTEPQTGTVNFTSDEIILHFNEFVDRNSLQNALLIEPDFGLIYDLDWGRKSVAIEFENELPDLTTLIVTIGTEFSDLNGNSLAGPVKIAVSTGPEIDEGKLIGRVFDARTGDAVKGNRVLLYRAPADLSEPANYIAETDTSGVVKFSYLRQGEYFAFWVDGRNRDKIWDPQQERAQPFGQKIISLEEADSDSLGSLFIANSDTSRPDLLGLGLFSNQRLRLRFSENITLTDSSEITISDTLGGFYSAVNPLYIPPEEPYILFAHSEEVLPEESSFQLNIENISDQAGNVLLQEVEEFTGSSQADTTAQRIVNTLPKMGVFPNEPIQIIYAAPITDTSIRDSLIIVEGDTAFTDWDDLQIRQNNLSIYPDTEWEEGTDYEIRAWNPDVEDYTVIRPTVWQDSDLGSLNITFADSTAEAAMRNTQLLLKTGNGQIVADTSFISQITLNELAPINHQIILYQDLNDNGQWDSGQIQPYREPEPYYIRNEIPIQPGFTSELSVRFEN